MTTRFNYARLREPFEESEIEWRIAQSGETEKGVWAKCLAYITSRAIMERMDEVFGPENWRCEYTHITTGNRVNNKNPNETEIESGVMCRLSVCIARGAFTEWVYKEDGAEQTDIESFKGGISSALKRAAVLWGVGRYLYDLEEGFAKIVQKGVERARYAQTKDKKPFYWTPPALPRWAIPEKPKTSAAIPQSVAAASKTPTSERAGPEDLEFFSRKVDSRKTHGWSGENLMKYLKSAHHASRVGELSKDLVENVGKVIDGMSFNDAMRTLDPQEVTQ